MNKKLLISLAALILLIGAIGYFVGGNGLKGMFGNLDFNSMTIKPAGTESFVGIDKLLPTPIAIPSLDSTNIAFREFQNGDEVLFRLANNSNQWKTGEIHSHMTNQTSFDVKSNGEVIKDLKPNEVAHFDLHPAFDSLVQGTVVIVKSGAEYHSATVDTLNKTTKTITFKKANSTNSTPGNKIFNVWLAAQPIVISAPVATFEALGKANDGGWYKANATLKTAGSAVTYDVVYSDNTGNKDMGVGGSRVADFTKHPLITDLVVNQKIIIESPNTPGTYWDATVKSLNGPWPLPATSVTATYEDEAKDATVTIDKVWLDLGPVQMKPVDTKVAEEQAIIDDLKNLDVILQPDFNLDTGDASFTFQISTEKLGAPAMYGNDGKKIYLNVKVDGKDVTPTQNGQSNQVVAMQLEVNDNNGLVNKENTRIPAIHWSSFSGANKASDKTEAIKLPLKSVEWGGPNGWYPLEYDASFMNISGSDSTEHTFTYTFTYNNKPIVPSITRKYKHGAPNFQVTGYTLDGTGQSGNTKKLNDSFSKVYCNAGCSNQIFTAPSGNDTGASSYQIIRIVNNGDWVVPANKANEYNIELKGTFENKGAVKKLTTISGHDVHQYTISHYNAKTFTNEKDEFMPGPKKEILLFVPTKEMYDQKSNAYGTVTQAYIKKGETIVDGYPSKQ